MVVFLGGIDLSSGAILALCTSCSGMFVNMGIPVFFCILMSMAIGVLCGLFNGALVARLRIPPIIATMASMNIFRGIAIVVTKGDWITGFPKYFIGPRQNLWYSDPILDICSHHSLLRYSDEIFQYRPENICGRRQY